MPNTNPITPEMREADAINAARQRCHDPSLSTRVRGGLYQVLRVTYAANGKSDIVPLSDWLEIGEACEFLDSSR